MPQTIACVVADLHLTLKRPACRADADWMATQAGYLKQLANLAEGLPILCAGDVFDKWNVTPELVNFALDHLPPNMICVPGQHDLPNHQIEAVNRSAYGVLVKAKKIKDISNDEWLNLRLCVDGFGWGEELTSTRIRNNSLLKVALIHRYCWMEGKGYVGAPEEAQFHNYLKALEGYDTAVFGDNHQPFYLSHQGRYIYNCGGFMVRRADEIGVLRPAVGYLFADGSVKRQHLDISLDKYQIVIPKNEDGFDVKEFLRQLDALGEHGLDFRDSVMQRLKKSDISKGVQKIILQALDNENPQVPNTGNRS